MTRKKRRLYMISLGMLFLAGAAALVLSALEENIVFFNSPSDIVEKNIPAGQRFRIGGLVEEGSVARDSNSDAGGMLIFFVTDGVERVKVSYRGLLPDLFREGQGVVAEGKLNEEGVFEASNVLAKHDENYMPPEVADALKRSGTWREGEEETGAGYAAPGMSGAPEEGPSTP